MFDDQNQPPAPSNLPFGAPQSPFALAQPQNQFSTPPVQTAPQQMNQAMPQQQMSQVAPPQTVGQPDDDMFAGIDPTPNQPARPAFYPPTQPATYGQTPSTGYAQPYSAPIGYGPEVSDIFGGKAFPWGKVVTVAIVVLVLAGGAGAIYWGVNYFSNANKSALPGVETDVPTVTEEGVTGENQTPTNPEPVVTIEETQILPEDKDTDGDGLSDVEETSLGTDITIADTDVDGLTDFAEIKIYKTDPLKADTDGDSYSDGSEVKNGYDPTKTGGARLFEIPLNP